MIIHKVIKVTEFMDAPTTSFVRGKSYPFTEKPTLRGDYCFWSYGCASMAPCYAAFDGETWTEGEREGCFWIYTDNPEPYGHYNTAIGCDPEVKNDLASRLQRYKEKKLTKKG